MYAVVSTGGKQLKVEEGMEAVVEKLDASVGDTVPLKVIFVADGDQIIVNSDALQSAKVNAEVVEHFKGEKQLVFKFKRRKGYKRLKGHRQLQTRIKVTGIDAADAKKAAKKPAKKAKPEGTVAKVEAAAKKAETKVETAAKKAEAKVESVVEKVEAKVEKKKEAKSKAKEAKDEKAPAAPKADKKKAGSASEVAQCEAIKGDGDRCGNKAKEGSKYCGVHAKKYDK